MRIAVCGGPYGNPYALQAFVDDARARGAERLFCLGDLGGFGADVDALWPILTDNTVECVAGNYDVAIARGDTDCGCGYRDPRTTSTPNSSTTTPSPPPTATSPPGWAPCPPNAGRPSTASDVHMVHGSTLALNDFWWESLPEEQHRLRAEASGADVVLCTHSGLPWQRQVGDTLAVNVGVLGKPANDGRHEVWYAILDLDDGHVTAELIPLAYDWRAQAALDARRRAARDLRGDHRDRLVDHLPGDPAAARALPGPVPPLPLHPALRLPPRRRRLGRDHAPGPSGRPAGGPAVRHPLLPLPAVDLHQLPLQPGLRLLRGRLLPESSRAHPAHRYLPRPGRRSRAGRVHRAVPHRR